MKTKLAILIFAFTTTTAAIAQSATSQFTKLDWALLGSVSAVRVNDAFSTHYASGNGGTDRFLPDSMATSRPAMLGYAAAVTGAQYLQRRYIFRSHPWVGRAIMIGDIAFTGYCGSHNWTIGKQKLQ
jgi:hypothetical protein